MASEMEAEFQDAVIHRTASVDPAAVLGSGVTIGPYATVGPGARIGNGTQVGPHACVGARVTVGEENLVAMGACLGVEADGRGLPPEAGPLVIGDGNTIREFVTIAAGPGAHRSTVLGNGNFIMASCHLGAGCRIGNRLVLANGSSIGDGAEIGDDVNISGLVRIENSVRIGRLAMVGGVSHLDRNVPPFTIMTGRPAAPRCLNYIGLKRCGLTIADRGEPFRQLKRLWLEFRRHGACRVEEVAGRPHTALSPLAEEFLAFFPRNLPAARASR
jgi:UDP-N-acetylglucosamine acyltransferase